MKVKVKVKVKVKSRNPLTQQCCFGYWEILDRKVLSLGTEEKLFVQK